MHYSTKVVIGDFGDSFMNLMNILHKSTNCTIYIVLF